MALKSNTPVQKSNAPAFMLNADTHKTEYEKPQAVPVILFNRNRYKSFQFSLYHSVVCVKEGKCYCMDLPKMGRDERGETKRCSSNVTLLPRTYSKPLPPAVLDLPQVRCALAEPNFIQIANKLAAVQVIKP